MLETATAHASAGDIVTVPALVYANTRGGSKRCIGKSCIFWEAAVAAEVCDFFTSDHIGGEMPNRHRTSLFLNGVFMLSYSFDVVRCSSCQIYVRPHTARTRVYRRVPSCISSCTLRRPHWCFTPPAIVRPSTDLLRANVMRLGRECLQSHIADPQKQRSEASANKSHPLVGTT